MRIVATFRVSITSALWIDWLIVVQCKTLCYSDTDFQCRIDIRSNENAINNGKHVLFHLPKYYTLINFMVTLFINTL